MNDVFTAIADPTRRQILKMLDKGSLNAGEIAGQFDMAKPSVTHHLNILVNAQLVTKEREGQNIVYTLNTTVLEDLLVWLNGFSLFQQSDTEIEATHE